MLRTKTVTWGDASVTVREANGLDYYEEPTAHMAIFKAIRGYEYDVDEHEIKFYEDNFMYMVTRTTNVENIGIEWVTHEDSQAKIKKAFQYMLSELPGGLVKLWMEAIRELMKPPIGDPDLVPPEMLTDDQKKVSASKKKGSDSENT